MENREVLISGAGIAGPALAYWLGRYGYRPTVVERAPGPRAGGQAVDFRGPVHLTVLERMGILSEVRQLQTHMGSVTIVSGSGRRLASLPASFMSGEMEILRGDLSRLLHDVTAATTEYIFGDSITTLAEEADGVRVTFERGAPRTFGLVVGADGLHSRVRALAFGDESAFIRFCGHYVAIFTAPNDLGLDHAGLLYNVPARGVSVSGTRNPETAGVMLIFAAPPLAGACRESEAQKRLVADTFAGIGWEVPRLLTAMGSAPDFYFDSLSQVHADTWSRGRVVLLGDAGYGATLGGLGTGLAMVGAHVLAGELAAAGGDHRLAFARYEAELRAYATGCQKLADGAGPFLAPPTRSKIWLRNQTYRLLSSPPLTGLLQRLTTKAASAIALKDYPVAG